MLIRGEKGLVAGLFHIFFHTVHAGHIYIYIYIYIQTVKLIPNYYFGQEIL